MSTQKKKELTEEQKADNARLKALYESRKNYLDLTQAKVSEALGISQGAINHYLNGINALNISIASKFARLLQVTVDEFSPTLASEIQQMSDTINPEKISQLPIQQAKHKNSVTIELLDIYAAASPQGIVNKDYPEVVKEIVIDQDKVIELLGRKTIDGVNLINVPTDSMAPTINKGDVAFIDTTCNGYTGEGVYIFVDQFNQLYIKRLQRLPNGITKILSDNPKYEPFDLTADELSRCYIMGKFIKALPLKMIDL